MAGIGILKRVCTAKESTQRKRWGNRSSDSAYRMTRRRSNHLINIDATSQCPDVEPPREAKGIRGVQGVGDQCRNEHLMPDLIALQTAKEASRHTSFIRLTNIHGPYRRCKLAEVDYLRGVPSTPGSLGQARTR